MNDLWDKLLVAVPIDKKAAIVTNWSWVSKKILELPTEISIILLLDTLELVSLISKCNGQPFFLVFKLLAQGHGFETWRSMVINCTELKGTDPVTIDGLKTLARVLEKKVKGERELPHCRALNIVAWRFGFKNYEEAASKMTPGPGFAKVTQRKALSKGKRQRAG